MKLNKLVFELGNWSVKKVRMTVPSSYQEKWNKSDTVGLKKESSFMNFKVYEAWSKKKKERQNRSII